MICVAACLPAMPSTTTGTVLAVPMAIPAFRACASFRRRSTTTWAIQLATGLSAYAARLDTDSDAPIGIATGRVRLPIHGAARGEDQREERLAQRRADALSALDLPPDAAPSTRDLYRLEHERTRGLPVDEVRERIARVQQVQLTQWML